VNGLGEKKGLTLRLGNISRRIENETLDGNSKPLASAVVTLNMDNPINGHAARWYCSISWKFRSLPGGNDDGSNHASHIHTKHPPY